MKRLALTIPALLAFAALPPAADAALIINFTQSGANVLEYAQGSINLGSLTMSGGINATAQVQGASADALAGSTTGAPVNFYSGSISGPSSFGSGATTIFASAGTGDTFGILGVAQMIVLPSAYTSGAFLTAGDTYNNQTFASLGLNQGTYQYSFGSGVNADTITVQIGSAAVPEPSSAVLTVVGLVATILIRRSGPERRSRAGRPLCAA